MLLSGLFHTYHGASKGILNLWYLSEHSPSLKHSARLFNAVAAVRSDRHSLNIFSSLVRMMTTLDVKTPYGQGHIMYPFSDGTELLIYKKIRS